MVRTSAGEISIETPQYRHSSFEPQIIRKRETVLAGHLAPRIIGLYGKGMSFRDISEDISEMYDVDISHSTLSEITDRVIPKVKEWLIRPLDDVYPLSSWIPCTIKSGITAGLSLVRHTTFWP